MERKSKTHLLAGTLFVLLFILWTIAVAFVDVQPIGPLKSAVGFSTINAYVHNLFGVHLSLYVITDWLSLIPLGFAFGFAILGLAQWINRRHLLKVDLNILILGIFYLTVFAVYILFEYMVINYRPILINGYLEVSYPSSTTVLVLCILPTAVMQFKTRIKHSGFRRAITVLIDAFTAFMVIGRILSGVHWITDIIGGVFISAGLLMLYKGFCILAIRKAPV